MLGGPSLVVALSLGVPSSSFHSVRQDDLLTGVWEGRGKGENALIPPEGFAFTLVLEGRGEDGALATLTMEGVPSTQPVQADFDPESGELAFRCDLIGIQLDVELVVEGEELTGTAGGLGVTVELAGKRTSRALPAREAPGAPRAPVDLTALGPEAWGEDLAFLAENLPRRHVNAFHTLSREEWERSVREIESRLPELSPAAAAVALARLVARIGDAHTELALAGKPFDRSFPVRFTWFTDGLFTTAVDERFGEILAARVRRIGEKTVEDALAAVSTTFACENDSWERVKAPPRLSQPALLSALGVLASEQVLPLALEGPDGEELSASIDGPGNGKWLVAPDRDLVETPLWLQRTNEAYWFRPLEPEHSLYLAYNRCAEDPARPMAGFMAEVFETLERSAAERLVIDLRHNSGGNSTVLAFFVPALAEHTRPPRDLCVLIGPQTYSSGMTNALELRDQAGARLFGEPTGGKPNSYGEVRGFALPRSGLTVYHSTKYFRKVAEDPPTVEPDCLVPLASAEYFAGVDPVLERALRED